MIELELIDLWGALIGPLAIAMAAWMIGRSAARGQEASAQAMRHENARLNDALKRKDEYVAKVSHELRTPLTAIKEGMNLVLDGSLGEVNAEQRDFLKTVDLSVERLNELINNILDLSKIDAGRLRLNRRRVAVAPLIDSLLGSYRHLAGNRSVRLESSPGLPEVFADPDRILQVIGNLFSNAVKFTPEEGFITFYLQRHGNVVAVTVRDSGCGIAKDDISKLFQKFSQVGGGQTKLRGTGLGLALCKELVELHGGSIVATSELNHGTSFTFTVPVYEEQLALQESFRELMEFGAGSQSPHTAVIALRPSAPGAEAERRIRKQVQQSDVVLSPVNGWIVVFALADQQGGKAILDRLMGIMAGGEGGMAVFPEDGKTLHALLARATTGMNGPREQLIAIVDGNGTQGASK